MACLLNAAPPFLVHLVFSNEKTWLTSPKKIKPDGTGTIPLFTDSYWTWFDWAEVHWSALVCVCFKDSVGTNSISNRIRLGWKLEVDLYTTYGIWRKLNWPDPNQIRSDRIRRGLISCFMWQRPECGLTGVCCLRRSQWLHPRPTVSLVFSWWSFSPNSYFSFLFSSPLPPLLPPLRRGNDRRCRAFRWCLWIEHIRRVVHQCSGLSTAFRLLVDAHISSPKSYTGWLNKVCRIGKMQFLPNHLIYLYQIESWGSTLPSCIEQRGNHIKFGAGSWGRGRIMVVSIELRHFYAVQAILTWTDWFWV